MAIVEVSTLASKVTNFLFRPYETELKKHLQLSLFLSLSLSLSICIFFDHSLSLISFEAEQQLCMYILEAALL